MAAKAYILIRTEPGRTEAIFNTLDASQGVQSVEMITGPYDLIAIVEGDTTNEVMAAVRREIRPSAGVWDTLTCLVIPAEK